MFFSDPHAPLKQAQNFINAGRYTAAVSTLDDFITQKKSGRKVCSKLQAARDLRTTAQDHIDRQQNAAPVNPAPVTVTAQALTPPNARARRTPPVHQHAPSPVQTSVHSPSPAPSYESAGDVRRPAAPMLRTSVAAQPSFPMQRQRPQPQPFTQQSRQFSNRPFSGSYNTGSVGFGRSPFNRPDFGTGAGYGDAAGFGAGTGLGIGPRFPTTGNLFGESVMQSTDRFGNHQTVISDGFDTEVILQDRFGNTEIDRTDMLGDVEVTRTDAIGDMSDFRQDAIGDTSFTTNDGFLFNGGFNNGFNGGFNNGFNGGFGNFNNGFRPF